MTECGGLPQFSVSSRSASAQGTPECPSLRSRGGCSLPTVYDDAKALRSLVPTAEWGRARGLPSGRGPRARAGAELRRGRSRPFPLRVSDDH